MHLQVRVAQQQRPGHHRAHDPTADHGDVACGVAGGFCVRGGGGLHLPLCPRADPARSRQGGYRGEGHDMPQPSEEPHDGIEAELRDDVATGDGRPRAARVREGPEGPAAAGGVEPREDRTPDIRRQPE